MRPYAKTFRKSKVHKATECRLCSERVAESKSPTRQSMNYKGREYATELLAEYKPDLYDLWLEIQELPDE